MRINIMLGKKNFHVAHLLLLSFCQLAQADTLSLDEYIAKVLEYNPGVHRILADEEIANARLKSSYGIVDSVLSSSLSLAHGEPNQITGKEVMDMDNRQFSVSLDRRFANIGTQLSLSYQNIGTEQSPSALIAGAQYYQPSLTLKLTQPLLKNAGGLQDQLNINLDRLGLELTRLSVREELESYITQLATLYLDWYLSYQEMIILKDVYEQVKEQEKVVNLKVKRQVAENYELLRVQETRQDYYSRWQQAMGKYSGLTHQVVNQLGASAINLSENSKPVDPADSKIMTADKIITRTTRYLMDISRLKNILSLTKSQQIELLKAKLNAQKPELNLSVGYTKHGVGDSISDAHSNIERSDYSVMLQYKQAIGNRSSEGKYEEQVAVARKVEADAQQRLINAKSNLENLSAQAEKLEVAVDSSSKKIELANLKIKQEYRIYKIGRLDLFQLLQDQKAQLESRINKIQLQIQLLKIELKIGELLDRNLDIYSTEKS